MPLGETVTLATNAHSLATQQATRGGKMLGVIYEAFRARGKRVFENARRYSSVQYLSLRQLRTGGHPYSRRGVLPSIYAHTVIPRPGLGAPPPFMVNLQSGDMHRKWGWRAYRSADGVSVTVYNYSSHARYFSARGTRFMIPRPILEHAVEADVLQQRSLLAQALGKEVKGKNPPLEAPRRKGLGSIRYTGNLEAFLGESTISNEDFDFGG